MELFHVLNRGVEKRQIFMDSMDHARFVHNLYEFNKTQPMINTARLLLNQSSPMSDLRGRSSRVPLVDVHAWVLMGNHYHLLLSERVEGGLTRFIMKLNVGYAKYFNEKYKRKGTLFQGRTKKILIDTDAHFLHIVHYIHLNPLDFLPAAKQWRQLEISDTAQALAHLEQYRWSSYLDYCGKKNFPSVITKGLFDEVYTDYPTTIRKYLQEIESAEIEQAELE